MKRITFLLIFLIPLLAFMLPPDTGKIRYEQLVPIQVTRLSSTGITSVKLVATDASGGIKLITNAYSRDSTILYTKLNRHLVNDLDSVKTNELITSMQIENDSLKITEGGILHKVKVQTSYSETDPVFSGWDKDYADLINKPTIPAPQIQSDWNQASAGALDYIKNKPTIPGGLTLPTANYIPKVNSGGTDWENSPLSVSNDSIKFGTTRLYNSAVSEYPNHYRTNPSSFGIKAALNQDVTIKLRGTSMFNIMGGWGLGFTPSSSGPDYGSGIGGIAYRSQTESMVGNFFIFRGGQYIFENESAIWQMIITPTGVNIGGLATNEGGAIPMSKFEVAGNATIGQSWDRTYAAPTNGLLVEGKVGVGTYAPTAHIHIKAGSATPNTAPLKLTVGTALSTPEDGAMEYHSSHLYFTVGSTRYQLDQQVGGGLSDAPSDSKTYGRNNAAWVEVGSGGGIADAPNDGKQYGRQSAAWTEITSTGGASGIWTALAGSYASSSTFTLSGTDKDVGLLEMSLVTCTNSTGATRRVGYIKTATNSSGTITCNVVTDTDLASGDKDFKIAYNRKATDYMRLVTIPGEQIADASYSQGMFYTDIQTASYLLPVDFGVITPASGSGAALTVNIYKNTTALFSSAPDLTTNTALRSQRPATNAISAAETVSLRIMSSAGATNKAADFQAKLYIVPQSIFTAF